MTDSLYLVRVQIREIMGCGASKTTAATEPRASTPTHGTYDAQIIDETPSECHWERYI